VFYEQARKALRPRGVLAVWCYGLLRVSPEVDLVIRSFYEGEVGRYWPPERRLVDEGYRTIAFPFEELEPPELTNEDDWDLAALLGYLRTWSAVTRFIAATGRDPVPGVRGELEAVWGDPGSTHQVRWPLHLRVGRT
jgi:hypothetical protein